ILHPPIRSRPRYAWGMTAARYFAGILVSFAVHAASIVTTVDSIGSVGSYTSLRLNAAGNPVVSYYDETNGDLKLATCTAACATDSPTWVLTVVDHTSADVGRFPSLELVNGNPVISYRDKTNGDLRLATCTADCATDVANWVFTTIDSEGDVGR